MEKARRKSSLQLIHEQNLTYEDEEQNHKPHLAIKKANEEKVEVVENRGEEREKGRRREKEEHKEDIKLAL